MMINLTREEAQQVLDALEKGAWDTLRGRNAAELLRARLSEYPDNFIDALKFHTAMQELEPEPVATQYKYIDAFGNDYWTDELWEGKKIEAERYLYTAPPQREWVGLTAQDLADVGAENIIGAIWADAKLKEKNHG